ncbi:GtrA family protein [Pseudomonas luteola]|uniref:GtrA family protein n=1 Tax=Pseudomonas luteola TaxID=47886 RepID=UPI001EF5C56F|nr:GtrA family protein [Pseudomonas luteola]MCG7375260.1 GtrA family protein [Pseudomonas luteola]
MKSRNNSLLQAGRFAIVGLVATAVHISILWVLINLFAIQVFFANLTAFIIAFLVSFSGHYLWTFKSSLEFYKAVIRFLLISLSGFLLNNIILITLLKKAWFSNTTAATLAVIIVPAITFIASKLWGFKNATQE